jgi:hypothetical protein
MINIDYDNLKDFENWVPVKNYYFAIPETILDLQKWCNDTYGIDGVGIHLYDVADDLRSNMGNLYKYRSYRFKLFFRNEADYSFFVLSYNLT